MEMLGKSPPSYTFELNLDIQLSWVDVPRKYKILVFKGGDN